MSTFSYELGYALGVAVREVRKVLRMHHRFSHQKPAQQQSSEVPTQHELDTPAIARKGVDLARWYDGNVHEIKPQRSRMKAEASKQ